jgi:hypothetical protein
VLEAIERLGQQDRDDVVPFHHILRRAAESLLCDVVSSSSRRGAAIKLLAADAMITYACEAMAEQDPESLATLR